jgi:hypothetical protein
MTGGIQYDKQIISIIILSYLSLVAGVPAKIQGNLA